MEIDQNSFQFIFASAIKSLFKETAKEFEKQGITINPEQNFMLKLIASQNETIQSDLADYLQKDKSAVMRDIDQMEIQGFVKRVNDLIDRRKKHIVITEAGFEILKKCKKLIDLLTKKNIKGISEEELSIFKKVLVKLKENAEK